jgi:serine/threonine protein phosphatase PrpC
MQKQSFNSEMIITYEHQGRREYMEDRMDFEENLAKGYNYYAIFDGHGGAEVASFVKTHMKTTVKALLQVEGNNKVHLVLLKAFSIVNENIPDSIGRHTGTTVIVILKKAKELWVANCGDSRAILGSSTKTIALTNDHKPNSAKEYERITSQGGFVARMGRDDVPRVNGVLAVSRSLGDMHLNPFVTWKPEILIHEIQFDDMFVFMATDGVWDALDNEQVADIVRYGLKQNKEKDIGTIIEKSARNNCSTDNLSFILFTI